MSFSIDTDWKLGFIGRNGKGKTTFLNLLLGKYSFSIRANVSFRFLFSHQLEKFPACTSIEWRFSTRTWSMHASKKLRSWDTRINPGAGNRRERRVAPGYRMPGGFKNKAFGTF